MVQGVSQVFRRRLEVKESIRVMSVLPVGARALFAADWDVEEAKLPFEDRGIMTKEIQGLRSEHNFALETAIRDVAIALRRNLDQAAFEPSTRYACSGCNEVLAAMNAKVHQPTLLLEKGSDIWLVGGAQLVAA
jgi:hypothetical protein